MASSATIGNLRVLLTADTAAFDKAMKGADASTQKLANTMKRDLEPSQTRINKLIRDFAGTKEIGNAMTWAKALEQAGTSAKLTAQQQEAANRAATKAIEVYRAMGQTVPPEINKLAVATARATTATTQMAAASAKAAQSSSLLGASFSRLTASFTAASMIDRVLGSLTQSVGLLVEKGLRLDGVERGFTNLTNSAKVNGDDMLRAMQQGTRGLVENVDLFQSANKAILLGLPVTVASMKEMSTAATALGRAMGQDATKSLDDMITALGRVSPLILDNLGLTVKVEEANKAYAASLGKTSDELTDQEKKIAFYNAAMDAARKKTAELGEQQFTLADQVSRAWVAVSNNIGSVVSGLNKILGEGVDQLIIDFKYLGSLVNPLSFKGAKSLEQITREREAAANRASFVGFAGVSDVQEVGSSFGLFGFTPSKEETKKIHDYSGALEKAKKELSGLSAETKKQIVSGIALGDSTKDIAKNLKVSEAAIEVYRDSIKSSADATKKAAEETARLIEKTRELGLAYQSFERQRVTGKSDKDQLDQFFLETFLDKNRLMGKFMAMEVIIRRGKSNDIYNSLGGYNAVFNNALSTTNLKALRTTDWGDIEFTPMVSMSPSQWAVEHLWRPGTPPKPGIGGLFGAGASASFGNMDKVIMQSVMGGGNVPKSIGALFGSNLSNSMMGRLGADGKTFSSGMGKQWQGLLGGKGGGMIAGMSGGIASAGLAKLMSDGGGSGMLGNIGSYAAAGMMFGPWGAAIGAGVGAIVGAFKKGSNATLKARQEFAKELGHDDLNSLLDKLSADGAEGKSLADRAMRGIGKQDKAGNQKWMKDVQAFFEKQAKTTQDISNNIGKAQQALERFGGVAPKSLRPFIDDLLKSNKLTADQRMALEAMGKAPTWQTIQARAEALGIDMGALGGNFNAARLKDMGFGLFHDIEMFLDQGADRDGVLRGMADELSALAAEAIKTNKPLPKVLEQYFRRLQEMGLLLDEQGNAITDGLVFQDMVDESLQQVVSVLEEIRDLLAGRAPGAGPAPSPGAGSGGGELGPKVPEEPTYRNPGDDWREGPRIEMPGFAGGTHGAYKDFGAGTPVMLHGKERVMTEAEGRRSTGNFYINAVDAASFQMFLRRGGANVIARELPDASGRYVGRR